MRVLKILLGVLKRLLMEQKLFGSVFVLLDLETGTIMTIFYKVGKIDGWKWELI